MERTVALAGNPNVGKSSLFNRLTGLRQHTGNWTGKTVETAAGRCGSYRLVDLPGTYSLRPGSAEERVTRDYLLRGEAEAVVVVCDACCLERNLILALQCRALCPRMLVCVNMLDEARRRGLRVDCEALSRGLGLPVIGLSAREKGSRAAPPLWTPCLKPRPARRSRARAPKRRRSPAPSGSLRNPAGSAAWPCGGRAAPTGPGTPGWTGSSPAGSGPSR